MTSERGLDDLKGLHQDLLALAESQLRNVDRLWAELDARIDEFRRLLDQPHQTDASRRILHSGEIEIDQEKYAVNPEFQQNATQLSDILSLDELASARLILEAQEDAEDFGRALVPSAVIRFHQRRSWILECLRLVLAQSLDEDFDEDFRDNHRQLLGRIVETKHDSARNGSLFIRKCLGAMQEIERWFTRLSDRALGNIALGQALSSENDEILSFQEQSLVEQHESLSAIVNALIRSSFSAVDDFYKLLDHMPHLDRWNAFTLHYVPVITAFASEFGSVDRGSTLREARILDRRLRDSRNTSPWPLRSLQAATMTWWLAEYSGWYSEQPTGSPVQNVNLEEEAMSRSENFINALGDGAFQCMIAICSQFVPYMWYDPARVGLIEYLLRDSPPLFQDLGHVSEYLQDLIMEQFEAFVEAFITNMPDTLRNFKAEEDTQRKKFLGSIQLDGHYAASEQMLHLERFLMIVSFSFDTRADAAQSFWTDADSNLYGFLQWASRRQSTPYVGAFCEMLRSISRSEQCATSAHHFLLEEGNVGMAKIRRSSSLSWAQIIAELTVYVNRVREHSQNSRSGNSYGGQATVDDIDEPETVLMLQTYLRLMAHVFRNSVSARSWILSQQEFPLQDVLFCLCNSTVPGRLKACVFSVLSALMTTKNSELNQSMWNCLDKWVSGGYENTSSLPRPARISSPAAWAESMTFAAIAGDFEQANEFTGLLHNLLRPLESEVGSNDQLMFPENLGSTYRMPGIEPYIDLLLGKIFAFLTQQVERSLEQRVLSWNVLNCIIVCLSTFNENLVLLSNRSTAPIGEGLSTSLLTYVRLHPFHRVMEWLFNERVMNALFASTHQPIEEVADSPPDSPLVLSLICGIDVMNLIMDMQSTYLDLVRPLIKLQNTSEDRVSSTSLNSFEDSVASHLELIVDLGLFAGLGNQELAMGALKLLEKLSSSRKLNARSRQISQGNRLIGALERNGDLERIARSLNLAMQFDARELERGPESQAWTIKLVILDFLSHCLQASPDKPTVAHALLGFKCVGVTVDIELDSLFAKGQSLFHAVLHLVQYYPDGGGETTQVWAAGLRQRGLDILSVLWTSCLTSVFTLTEMRSNDTLSLLFLRQRLFDYDTTWEGRSLKEPDFMFTESAETLYQAFLQRCFLIEYSTLEYRLSAADDSPSLRARIFATFLGSTSLLTGEQIANLTIFDLLDFAELDIPASPPCSRYAHFADLDFDVTIEGSRGVLGETRNLRLVSEMIRLRMTELLKAGRLQDPTQAEQANGEATDILNHFQGENHRHALRSVKQRLFSVWADLLKLIILTCDLEQSGKAALILQAFQLLTPKLDFYTSINAPEVGVIASLFECLLPQLDLNALASDRSRAGGAAHDRLFQVFRVSLRGISNPGVSTQLREILYSICHRYTQCIGGCGDDRGHERRKLSIAKLASEQVIETICDDAYGASASCRIAALLLLDSLVKEAAIEKSDHVIQMLSRMQFLQILIESIERISLELRETEASDVPLLLVYYDCQLSLLLTISCGKVGAALLMEAGLFAAIQASGLFSVDPDLGIEIDNPEALGKYYKLLLAITRVVTSIVLSRGQDNDLTISRARTFLTENRSLMVSIFKRHAKIGGVSFDDAGMSIEELVELFMLLIAMTDFLKHEDLGDTHRPRRLAFT